MLEPKEEIRNRLSIVTVVGNYVTLKKTGGHYKGLCPFHKEKTPSFVVSEDKEIAYCFGCHKGGDMFRFIELVENVEFGEALRILAKQANVEITGGISSKQMYEKDKDYHAILKSVQEYYALQLSLVAHVRDYIERRGFSPEQVKTFGFGYGGSTRTGLGDHLKKEGFSLTHAVDLGVIMKDQRRDNAYVDRFSDRLTIPFFNLHGDLVGFTARLLVDSSDLAKYINSPESSLYNKGKILFGLYHAKQAIRDKGYAVLVEGNMDALKMHACGFAHTVATSGTALTLEQLKLLNRFTKTLYFFFDMDSSGRTAVMRNAREALMQGFEIMVPELKDVKDPDEALSLGTELVDASLKDAKPFFSWIIEHLGATTGLTSAKEKRDVAQAVLEFVRLCPDLLLQDEALGLLASKTSIPEDLLRRELMRNAQKVDRKSAQAKESVDKNQQFFSKDAVFFGVLLYNQHLYQTLGDAYLRDTVQLFFQDSVHESLYRTLKDFYNDAKTLEETMQMLSPEHIQLVRTYTLYIDERYPETNDEILQQEGGTIITTLMRYQEERRKKDLLIRMKQAKTQGDLSLYETYFQEYNSLLK